jgi:hypothetical protein
MRALHTEWDSRPSLRVLAHRSQQDRMTREFALCALRTEEKSSTPVE